VNHSNPSISINFVPSFGAHQIDPLEFLADHHNREQTMAFAAKNEREKNEEKDNAYI
jgi:hypothetical protein